MNRICKGAASLLAACAAAGLCLPAAAAEQSSPYTAVIPIRITDSGGKLPEGTEFTIRLEPVGNAPMPAEYELTADTGSGCEFGPIEFYEPGSYEYTVSEVRFDSDDIIFDDAVYSVDIEVFTEEDGKMWGGSALYKDGEIVKAEEIVFVNDRDTSNDESSLPDESSEVIAESSSAAEDESSKPPGETSSAAESSLSDSSSKKESSAEESDSSSRSWLGTLAPPNTGGRVALAVSGLIIPMSAAMLILRRREKNDEPQKPTDPGGSR